jgi:hypothetical protein
MNLLNNFTRLHFSVPPEFQGDSGGGLMGRRDAGQSVLYGLVLFGTGCQELLASRNPNSNIFTDIALHKDDIDNFIGDSSKINLKITISKC